METTESAPVTPFLMLTIDTRNLGDVFLPAERRKRASMKFMWDTAVKKARTKNHDHFVSAYCALEREWDELVYTITSLGGLLLIGGAA